MQVTHAIGNATPAALTGAQVDRVLDLFRNGKTDATLAAYDRDLEAFGRWVAGQGRSATSDAQGALRALVEAGPIEGRFLVAGWASWMGEQGDDGAPRFASATIARRLAAVRSAFELARDLGLVSWDLKVATPRVARLRDVSGMGEGPLRRVVAHLREDAAGGKAKAVRDYVVALLLAHLALRRVEVVRLNVADVDLEGGRVWVLGKGRKEREDMTATPALVDALRAWLEVRDADGEAPLFVGVDRHGKLRHGRLTTRSVERLFKDAASAAGEDPERFSPHKARHTAITTAARLAGGDLSRVQRLSRHRDVRTVSIYVDHVEDAQGALSRGLAEAFA